MSFILKKECPAAGSLGYLLENFVAAQNQATVVRGNRVNDDFSPLRHFDGLRPGEFTLIIFAVADDDNGLANRMIRPILQELFATGAVNRIIECCASAIFQVMHSGGKQP